MIKSIVILYFILFVFGGYSFTQYTKVVPNIRYMKLSKNIRITHLTDFDKIIKYKNLYSKKVFIFELLQEKNKDDNILVIDYLRKPIRVIAVKDKKEIYYNDKDLNTSCENIYKNEHLRCVKDFKTKILDENTPIITKTEFNKKEKFHSLIKYCIEKKDNINEKFCEPLNTDFLIESVTAELVYDILKIKKEKTNIIENKLSHFDYQDMSNKLIKIYYMIYTISTLYQYNFDNTDLIDKISKSYLKDVLFQDENSDIVNIQKTVYPQSYSKTREYTVSVKSKNILQIYETTKEEKIKNNFDINTNYLTIYFYNFLKNKQMLFFCDEHNNIHFKIVTH